MTNATLTIEGADVLTHSRTQAFGKCRRLHHYRYNLGIRPQTDAKPLRIGSAVHEALDQRAKGASVNDAIAYAIEPYGLLPKWCQTDEQLHEWACEAEYTAAVLRAYFAHYDATPLQPECTVAEIVHSEIDFELSIINPETQTPMRLFTNRGKIDKIVRLGDGRLAIMEHKTTSDNIEPGSDYWLKLTIDQQISRYMCAAQDLGYDVQTVLYDVIGKPGQSPKLIPLTDPDGVKVVMNAAGERVRTKDGKKWRESADTEQGFVVQTRRETPQEYGARVEAVMLADPHAYFARREVPRLTSDLDAFRQELYDQAQDIAAANKSGRHFRNTSACVGFGRCEYLDVCGRGVEPTRENPPAGMVAVTTLHPELEGVA